MLKQRLKYKFIPLFAVLLVLSFMLSPQPAHAADWDFAQVRIEAQSPIASLTIAGVNQNDDPVSYDASYSYAQNIMTVPVNDWWWRFQYTCFIIFECGTSEDYSPYIWVRYFDGYLEHYKCSLDSPNATHDGQWVTCRFSHISTAYPGDPGNGGSPISLPPPPTDPNEPDPDPDGDGVPASRDQCPTRGDEGHGVDENGCPIPPPNFSLNITDVTQGTLTTVDVNGDQIEDFVQGKPLVVFVRPSLTEPFLLDSTTPVDISVTAHYSNNTAATLTYIGQPITVQYILNLEQDETLKFYLDQGPAVVGDVTFTATIDPANKIEESNESESDNSKSANADVKDTRSIQVATLAITWRDPNTGDVSNVQDMSGIINRGMDLTRELYPVNPDELTEAPTGVTLDLYTAVTTDPLKSYLNGRTPFTTADDGSAVLVTIIENVGSRAKSSATQYVGIAPLAASNYYGGLFGRAESIGGGNSAVVFEGSPTKTFPHEIGHNYGLTHIGDTINGFSVVHREYRNNYINFMRQGDFNNAWITPSYYTRLFEQFRTDPADPELIIFAGFVSDTGSIDLLPLFYTPDGIATDNVGTNTLELFDLNGAPVYSMPFQIYYEIDEQPTSFGFFSFKSYFPETAVSAQLVTDTGYTTQMNMHTDLLRDYINSIPDHGFVKNPSQRRNALLNQVSALETQYARADLNGIVTHLREIRARVDQYVLGSYGITNPYHVSKAQILGLIDELLVRVQTPTP